MSLSGTASLARDESSSGSINEKKKTKLIKSARKWIERFIASCGGEADDVAPTLLSTSAPSATHDGFVVLNGGTLASSSPYDVRRLLLASGVVGGVQTSLDQTPILKFSPSLPFVLVERPLLSAQLDSFVLSWSSRAKGAGLPTQLYSEGQVKGLTVRLYVVPIPESFRRVNAGDAAPSSNGMGEALFLMPCEVAVVQRHFHHVFQRPVVGSEGIVGDTKPVPSASTSQVRPRHIVAKPVEEIPGLFVISDFLSQEEHDCILKEMQDRDHLQLQYLQRRRVAHFNRRFVYGSNVVAPVGLDVNPQPSFFEYMQRRLHNRDSENVIIDGALPDFDPALCDQLTVNYYDYSDRTGRSCGIAPHVDAHSAFMNQIFIVSLGSYTVMEFKRWDSKEEDAGIPVLLQPRTLAILSGEARYGWEHAILEKRTDLISELLPPWHRGDRVSLTWRVARENPHDKATCPWPALCDGK